MSSIAPTNALRAGNKVLGALSRTAALQRRCLSTSQSRQATHVIKFSKTKDDKLNEILATIRDKIILPSYLPLDQQKRLYNEKYKAALEADPIILTIDGEELRFSHRNRLSDLPNTKKSFKMAVDAMTAIKDFQNLSKLLEGVTQHAGRKLDPVFYSMLVRRAGQTGNIQVILDAVRNVKRTGLKLDQSATINELLVWIQKEAVGAGWQTRALELALKRTQLVLDLLEGEPRHAPKRARGPEIRSFPFFRDPQFLAMRLNLAAALAINQKGGKGTKEKVVKYAEELVKLWPKGAGLLDLEPAEAYKYPFEMGYMLNRNVYLWAAAPVLSGLTLAAKVVESELANQLLKRAKRVEGEVITALETAEAGRGVVLYKQIFEEQPFEKTLKAEESEKLEKTGHVEDIERAKEAA
ncbi:hypothetical protein B0H67DRAFT_685236 [Lasiosphaeris hirsuta]|uniref:Uncharacterized protein n=1 Tax=Lasiosphaeris hirsuta TaxID=260670 RepID=A0AA40A9B7_9PEZI|nr:hypothetical protein B0H67DRAFT_685236 [Lasiosphaeris hirsuta]